MRSVMITLKMTQIITFSDAVTLTLDPWHWRVNRLLSPLLCMLNLRTIHSVLFDLLCSHQLCGGPQVTWNLRILGYSKSVGLSSKLLQSDEKGIPGLILGLRPANERRRYFVTTSYWLGVSLDPALHFQGENEILKSTRAKQSTTDTRPPTHSSVDILNTHMRLSPPIYL